MSDYVVYHNKEGMGYTVSDRKSQNGPFQIVTTKNVNDLEGSRIWLIEGQKARQRKNKTYYLCSQFRVDDTYEDEEINYARGMSGSRYGKKICLNDLLWFPEFLKRMANFSLGMQKLSPEDVKNLVAEVSKLHPGVATRVPLGINSPPPHSRADSQSPQPDASTLNYGQGFADSEIIRHIEEFAMNYVTKILATDGWNVADKSKDKGLGYDLLCHRKGKTMHVEVKGTTGPKEVFLLQASQRRQAEIDPDFYIYCVMGALSENPECKSYNGKELLRLFKFEPTVYRVSRATTVVEQRAESI